MFNAISQKYPRQLDDSIAKILRGQDEDDAGQETVQEAGTKRSRVEPSAKRADKTVKDMLDVLRVAFAGAGAVFVPMEQGRHCMNKHHRPYSHPAGL